MPAPVPTEDFTDSDSWRRNLWSSSSDDDDVTSEDEDNPVDFDTHACDDEDEGEKNVCRENSSSSEDSEDETGFCDQINLSLYGWPVDVEAITETPGFLGIFSLEAPSLDDFKSDGNLKGELVRSMETVNKLGEIGQVTAPIFLTDFAGRIDADKAKLTLNSLGTRGRCVYVKELPRVGLLYIAGKLARPSKSWFGSSLDCATSIPTLARVICARYKP